MTLARFALAALFGTCLWSPCAAQVIPERPLPAPRQPVIPTQPALQRPTPAVPIVDTAAPRFDRAELLGTRLRLTGVSGVEGIGGFCRTDGKTRICWQVTDAHAITVNGRVTPGAACEAISSTGGAWEGNKIISVSDGELICTLSAAPPHADGTTVEITLSRPFLGQQRGTTRRYLAYRCRSMLLGITSAGGNAFTLRGDGLRPYLAGVIRDVEVWELAQYGTAGSTFLSRIPVMQTTDTPDGVQVTLDHPDLSRKILSFRVTMRGCRGTPDPSGVQVLFEEGRANPAFDKSSHWAEFRMPGARDDNSALDISAPLRVAGQSGLTEPAIGRSYTLNAQLYNRGSPIPDVTIEVTASGQIQLGTTGMHNVPGVWPTLTENNEIGLTCQTLTPQRYVCRLPSYPGGMPARTLQVGFTPVGSSSGAGSITLQAYGPTLTRQYNSVTLPVTFDAASTADRAITALGWSPAVPAGRDLSRSEFMSLPAHRAEVTVTNRGPAAITGWEVAVEVVSTPAPYGLFWQLAAGDTLPAGCAPASLQDANQSRSRIIVRCGMPQELQAGASVSFSIPVRIVDVVPAVNAAPDWPRCPDQTMGCYPPGLALIASFSRKGAPDLDPDRLNDTFPRTEINASNQSLFTRPIEVRVCGGSWSLNGVTPRGSFASLRCNP